MEKLIKVTPLSYIICYFYVSKSVILKTSKQSAGILVHRVQAGALQFLLVHPGGPFFKKKDVGAWSIPKGEFTDDEEPLVAAQREFLEELGIKLAGPFTALTPIVQKAGKKVYAWATSETVDITGFSSNTFTMEWPPKSGKQQTFPEVDNAEWFDLETAMQKINPAQVSLLLEVAGLSGKN